MKYKIGDTIRKQDKVEYDTDSLKVLHRVLAGLPPESTYTDYVITNQEQLNEATIS